MRPELAAFFASMEAFFRAPPAPEALRARHPGWDAPPGRLALYHHMVEGHVRGVLEKLYPRVRACLAPDTWEALVQAHRARRPGRHFELNQVGATFPELVAGCVEADGLPPFLPALARFEWEEFAVYASEEEVPVAVERLTPNPTLVVLEHPWQLCAFVRTGAPRGTAPAEGPEVALLWRHPTRHDVLHMQADSAALLVLKVAVEGRSVAETATAIGQAPAWLEAQVARLAEAGLVLLPP